MIEIQRVLLTQNRLRQEPDAFRKTRKACEDGICRILVGTAPHRMRGCEAEMLRSSLVYAVLQTGRAIPVPGDEEIRHILLLWRKVTYCD